MTTALSVVQAGMRRLRPPPEQTVSEWADAHRVLPSEGAAEPGPWRTDRAPYQREIMDAISTEGVERVVFMKSAQVGATEVLNNAIGRYIHRDPGPMMVVQPTVEMARDYSERRIAPMIRDCPGLAALVYTRRSAEGGNNKLYKSFPGGSLAFVGANSPAGLASRPVGRVFLDEVDRFPASAGEEGDPMKLAEARTKTFHNRKVVVTATPTIKGRSVIEREFLLSDQHYYHVPCPECGTLQRLVWEQLRWDGETDDGFPINVRYECEHCNAELRDDVKDELLAGGMWVAAEPGRKTRGFHISELYSPWVTWETMVIAFLEAKDDTHALKVWWNTALGEPWEEYESTVEAQELLDRTEDYPQGTPPAACVFLTAAVDVQDDRLEVLTKGWARGGESWAIEHRLLIGDPRREQVWEQLDRHLAAPYRSEDGREMRIMVTCIDSGFLADHVYAFCENKKSRGIYAVKGIAGQGRPILSRPSKRGRGERAVLIPVGVDTAKDVFYPRLAKRKHGPGFQHYPRGDTINLEFFHQLTAEVKEVVIANGRKSVRWVKVYPRNEALDLEVYNLAAYMVVSPDFDAIEANASKPKAERPKPKPKPAIRRRNRRP